MVNAMILVTLLVLAADSKDSAAAAAAAAAEAQKAATAMRDANDRGNAECAPLEKKPVDPREEKLVGQRLTAGTKVMSKSALTDYVQKLGEKLAGASKRKNEWTFGIIEDPAPRTSSEVGGYVFVTTGLLAKLSNEAEVAAALAHEVAHVASNERTTAYITARASACRIALVGYYLTAAGAMGVPGGDEFIRNAKFGQTMRAFAARDSAAMYEGPDVDAEFVTWFLKRVQDQQRMIAPADAELAADKLAAELLQKTGYDAQGLVKVIELVDTMHAAERTAALPKPKGKGKTPPLPKGVDWPK